MELRKLDVQGSFYYCCVVRNKVKHIVYIYFVLFLIHIDIDQYVSYCTFECFILLPLK